LPDSAQESIGLSTYVYGAANPVKFTDPDGRDPRTPVASGGSMDPSTIRFTQDSVSSAFQDGRTLGQLVDELKANPAKAASVEPVKVFQDRGVWFTLDNRRVVAFQKAGVQINYVVATAEDIVAAKEAGKFTTTNDGVSVEIRHEGKPSSQWETHRVKNPGTAKSTVSRLSPTNRGLACSSGIPCGPPPRPGFFYRAANVVGKAMTILMIFQALKADYDHYTNPQPTEPKRKVMMIWPFPGFTFTPAGGELEPA
jgi:hypothetical protein